MVTTVLIEMPHYQTYYFDDPGEVPGTPTTGFTLSPEVEEWLRQHGGCEGWRLVDVEDSFGSCDLFVEVTFSVQGTAEQFAQAFPLWRPAME